MKTIIKIFKKIGAFIKRRSKRAIAVILVIALLFSCACFGILNKTKESKAAFVLDDLALSTVLLSIVGGALSAGAGVHELISTKTALGLTDDSDVSDYIRQVLDDPRYTSYYGFDLSTKVEDFSRMCSTGISGDYVINADYLKNILDNGMKNDILGKTDGSSALDLDGMLRQVKSATIYKFPSDDPDNDPDDDPDEQDELAYMYDLLNNTDNSVLPMNAFDMIAQTGLFKFIFDLVKSFQTQKADDEINNKIGTGSYGVCDYSVSYWNAHGDIIHISSPLLTFGTNGFLSIGHYESLFLGSEFLNRCNRNNISRLIPCVIKKSNGNYGYDEVLDNISKNDKWVDYWYYIAYSGQGSANGNKIDKQPDSNEESLFDITNGINSFVRNYVTSNYSSDYISEINRIFSNHEKYKNSENEVGYLYNDNHVFYFDSYDKFISFRDYIQNAWKNGKDVSVQKVYENTDEWYKYNPKAVPDKIANPDGKHPELTTPETAPKIFENGQGVDNTGTKKPSTGINPKNVIDSLVNGDISINKIYGKWIVPKKPEITDPQDNPEEVPVNKPEEKPNYNPQTNPNPEGDPNYDPLKNPYEEVTPATDPSLNPDPNADPNSDPNKDPNNDPNSGDDPNTNPENQEERVKPFNPSTDTIFPENDDIPWYERFPFCIPWDLYNAVSKLNQKTKAPSWAIPVKVKKLGVNEKVNLDVGGIDGIETVRQIVRWFLLLLYILGLIMISRYVIKG